MFYYETLQCPFASTFNTQINPLIMILRYQEQLKNLMGLEHPTLTSITDTQINPLIMILRYKNNLKTEWVWYT
jgi:hypothetical protein